MARCETYHYVVDDEDAALMKGLYEEGLSGRTIAEKFDVHYRTVHRTLRHIGVRLRKTNGKEHESTD